jgi:aryl sulfotransferase
MTQLVNEPTRRVRSFVLDSARWDTFRPRSDDVIVATYPKCGTTWTQRIVTMLLHQSPAPRDIMGEAPWIDSTLFGSAEEVAAALEAQRHRRSMKSHLPLDAIPVLAGVKVIHTVRDGRDACVSMQNHMLGIRPEVAMRVLPQTPPEVLAAGPPPAPTEDSRAWFLQWMDAAEGPGQRAGGDLAFCEFELTYWKRRREPWLLFVHYNDLKADLAGEIQRISDFLDLATPPALVSELAAAATFEAMRRDGDAILPRIGEHFDKGAGRFLNKGTNGRWKDFLTPEDLARYDALIARKLPPDMARWVEHGRLVAGEPRDLGPTDSRNA